MPRNARIAAITAALIGAAFLLAAIWFPENLWKLICSAIVMFMISVVSAAIGSSEATRK